MTESGSTSAINSVDVKSLLLLAATTSEQSGMS